MRVLIFLMLSLPLSSFAEDSFDTKLENLLKDLDTTLMHTRVKTKFKKYPNEDYIAEYNKVVEAHIAKEIALHKEFCKKDGDKACLSDEQVKEKKSQYKVLTIVENRKHDMAAKGLTEEQIKQKVSEYSACYEDKKDCDKLPEAERDIASVETPVRVSKKSESKTEKKEEGTDAEASDPRDVKTVDLTKPESKVEVRTASKKAEVSVTTTETKKDDAKDVEAKDKDEEAQETTQEKAEKDKTVKADEKAKEEKATDASEVVELDDDEKAPRNYKPETCRWVTDLPRKIVNGPGCGPKNRSKICTGYVICEQKQGGAKFIRMSTCAADKCGSSDEDAVRCTKDMGYYSMKPQGESKLFMSPELKKILSGGATRQ